MKKSNDQKIDDWQKKSSVMNVVRRATIGPTVQTQIGRNIMTKKSTTIARIRHVKNKPKQREIIINTFN